MKNLSLRWKFGIVVFFALLVIVFILLLTLRGFLNREFDALYGDPATKGLFIADLLIHDLKPIIEKDIDSQELQQTVDSYKSLYGVYGVRYIFLLDADHDVIVDTYKERVPQGLIDLNLLPEGKAESVKPFTSGNYNYHDSAVSVSFSEKEQGTVRIGILEQNPEAPVWQTLKATHVKGMFIPLLLIAVLLAILMTVLLTAAFWYLVIQRIVMISQATERMSFGDLETEVDIQSQDELGVLEDTLERMRANLKDAIERLKRRK